MGNLTVATKAAMVLSLYVLTSLVSGCVVTERREGYWDSNHHRYWHAHAWVACTPNDEHCR